MSSSTSTWLSRIVGALLLAAFAYQAYVDWTTYGRVWTARVLAHWSESAVTRAARHQQWLDEEDRKFIDYARDVIPAEATVMIPEREAHFVFAHEGMMQQFLFPRRIVRCEPTSQEAKESCLATARLGSYYLMLPEEFGVEGSETFGYEINVYRGELSLGIPVTQDSG